MCVCVCNPWKIFCNPGPHEVFWQNDNHQAVEKMKSSKLYVHIYIYIYILFLLLLLYDSSILDIEHSQYYIVLGSIYTHKVI